MINFRYHIVSLMAVFLALAVGITMGVTLVSGEANKGLAAQAEQDRKQVQTYREQLAQTKELDKYRDAYAAQVGTQLTAGMLAGSSVALISMPNAPGATVSDLKQAIKDAGGTVASTTSVSADVFDPEKSDQVKKVIEPYSKEYSADDSLAAQVGTLVGRAVLAPQSGVTDQQAKEIGDTLNGQLIKLDRSDDQTAQLAIVVTAAASDPPIDGQRLERHVQFDLALDSRAAGTVIAGPNSTGTDGTDVATVRTDPDSRTVLSTVDVADLRSGVTTVIMAGREQLDGHQGHYGASNADSPAPELPVR
ncbi:copper transporter [Microlunatus elymi]|uniref:Copper transporter n=1 Tax=Microlunatus elymi TaxID=2596828 RepID=A0A516Q1J8_9ACTN|nr:copper transporter [Microlunatus elymi]QDP97300.1 copper transporter [Microlunatus elymi]